MISHLHPFFVHFPVALYSTALIIEIIRLFKQSIPAYFSLILVGFGAIMGLMSGLSGDLASNNVEHIPVIAKALEYPATSGNLLDWIGLISGFLLLFLHLKKKSNILLRLIILIILVMTVITTAFLGSELVHDFGAGTMLTEPPK